MYLASVLSTQVYHPCVRTSQVTFIVNFGSPQLAKLDSTVCVVLQHCSDDPGASSDPGIQPSSDPGIQPSSNPGLAGECRE